MHLSAWTHLPVFFCVIIPLPFFLFHSFNFSSFHTLARHCAWESTLYTETRLIQEESVLKKIVHLEYIHWNIDMVLLCFVLLWLCYQLLIDSGNLFIDLSRVASHALEQPNDFPSASEVTLNDMNKISHYHATAKHNKVRIMWILTAKYCTINMFCMIKILTVVHLRFLGFDKFPGGRLNKKDGLTRYGDSHVKDKTS